MGPARWISNARADWVGKHQYSLGKILARYGRYEDALEAFKAAENWYAQNLGAQHPYVGSALIRQGLCNAKLDRLDAACCAYRHALAIVEETVGTSHQQAVEIRGYLTAACHDHEDRSAG
jgi:tetratricopeptide (TPR) repeat protein